MRVRHATSLAVVSFLLVVGLYGTTAAENPGPNTSPVTVGQMIERRLEAGQRHGFRLAASSTPRLVTVEQLGVDLVLEAVLADTTNLATPLRVDNPLDRQGSERLVLEPSSNAWELTVHGREAGAPAGAYRLTVIELDGSEGDRLAAERAASRAGQLYAAGGAEGFAQAIEALEQAQRWWLQLEQPEQQARSLHLMAVLSRLADEPRQALELARLARRLWQRLDEPHWQAVALNEIGLCRWQLDDLDAARQAFAAALAVGPKTGPHLQNRSPSEVSLHLRVQAEANLCLLDLVAGDLAAGVDCYEGLMPRLMSVQSAEIESAARTSVGRAWELLGESGRAAEHFRRALDLQAQADDAVGRGKALNNLAALERKLGAPGQALTLYAEALDLFRRSGKRRWQARVLDNLGVTYLELGDLSAARSHNEQALALRREIGDTVGEARSRENLAFLDRKLGRFGPALSEGRRALELWRASGRQREIAGALYALGVAHTDVGRMDEAEALFEQAVHDFRQVGDLAGESRALRRLAETPGHAAELDQALATLERSVDLATRASDPLALARAEVSLARFLGRSGALAEAEAQLTKALERLEGLRLAIHPPRLRRSFSAARFDADELAVALAMARHRQHPEAGHAARALALADRARARSLGELLRESGAGLLDRTAPELRQRHRSLRHHLRDKQRALAATDDPELGARLAQDLLEVRRQLDLAEVEIRRQVPRWRELVAAEGLPVETMQRQLEPKTLLLVYQLGREGSFLWALDGQDSQSFDLGNADPIAAASRRLHRLLATREGGDDERLRLTTELGQKLLGPIADRLTRSLVIVADGALHTLPFSILPSPITGRALVEDHQVAYLPSVGSWVAEKTLRARRPLATGPLAVVADPVFAGELARLPHSRQEAQAVLALAPAGPSLAAFGFDADRQLLLDGTLEPYRVLHFATHGVIDGQNPERSGLVFSTLDSSGHHQDGWVRIDDLANLRLSADLVVLSGCETGLGQEVRGEGLLGLARGFQEAGVPRLIVSLWPVEDRATAALMTAFYRAYWQEDVPAAEALRRARQETRQHRRWRHPFYWAGFVLLGDPS